MLTPGIAGVQMPGLTLKAWALFDGATGTIRKSSGFTSLTRTAAGTYTLVFSSAAATATYIVKGEKSVSNGEFSTYGNTTAGFNVSAQIANGGAITEFPSNYIAVYE